MKYCVSCGEELNEGVNFCKNCGQKTSKGNSNESLLSSEALDQSSIGAREIEKINKRIEIQNNQTGITKKAWYVAIFFALVIVIAFMDFDTLPIHPAIVMISIFLFITSLVVGFMFRSREKKLQSLISGENLLASWKLNDTQKATYVNYLFNHEKGKNLAILAVISVISIIIFGVFILVIDEGKFFMFLVLIGLLGFLALFAFGMPIYYKNKNSKNEGNILIGAKFAYINGFFHNWDFPLSGLSKVKVMQEPFYGINLIYYYTDRTLKNTEELFIPANENHDLNDLVAELKEKN